MNNSYGLNILLLAIFNTDIIILLSSKFVKIMPDFEDQDSPLIYIFLKVIMELRTLERPAAQA